MINLRRLPRTSMVRTCAIALGMIAFAQFPGNSTQAQMLDQLKGAVGSGQGGNSGSGIPGLGGGGIPSVTQASPSNTAGVLQYCVRNNYVSGDAASSVKNSLMSKVGGGQGANNSGFTAGNNGLLDTGNGQSYSLGGSGIKAQITHKVCDEVLQHAKSML